MKRGVVRYWISLRFPFFSHENGLRENIYKVFFPPHFPRCILSRIQRRVDTKNPRTRPSSPPPFQRTQEETFRALFLDTHARTKTHTHTCPKRGEREFASAGVCRRRRPIADDDIAARSSYGTHIHLLLFPPPPLSSVLFSPTFLLSFRCRLRLSLAGPLNLSPLLSL